MWKISVNSKMPIHMKCRLTILKYSTHSYGSGDLIWTYLINVFSLFLSELLELKKEAQNKGII